MTHRKYPFHFTLIDFDGEVIEERDAHFSNHANAIARAFDLFYSRSGCARVITESSFSFHVTLEWGVRKSY